MALLAPGSQAAADTSDDGGVWDRLANCESSGNWAANTGNGFYGGLQFYPPTWDAYGGRKYADRPDLATRGQQITVAQKVRVAQGWEAWPACSRKLGLGPGDIGTDGGEPGGAPHADGSGGGTGSGGGGQGGGGASGSGSAGGTGSGGGSGGNGAGGTPSGSPDTDDNEPVRSGGGASGPGHDSASGGSVHVVESGDTLSDIAFEHDVPGGWTDLYEQNHETVGDNPHLIKPGMRLWLPVGKG